METSPSFNQLVYALVRHIPPGKVLNYGRVAYLLGVPRGARAVGWALSLLKHGDQGVPWHRVVNAHGRVSIKGSPEGAAEQRARLEAGGSRSTSMATTWRSTCRTPPRRGRAHRPVAPARS